MPVARGPRGLAAIALVAVLGGRGVVDAHEFWVSVSAPRLPLGQDGSFVVGFGERFPTGRLPADGAEIEARIISPSGRVLPAPLSARGTADELMTGVFPGVAEPGLYTVEASMQGRALTYAAAEFQAYLTREHLSSALAFRRALQEETRDAREIVSMFAKGVVRVGPPAAATPVRTLGTKIELVPLGDPTIVRVGDTLHVRLFFNHGPLPDAPVAAISHQGGVDLPSLTGKTNGSGEVDFEFSRPGVWLIRAVKTLPRSAVPGLATEWESYWASLTVTVAPK